MKSPLSKLRHFLGEERRKGNFIKVGMNEINTAIKIRGGGKVTMTLLVAHALEKGMGIQNVKKGYGIKKAERLCELLAELKKCGNDTYVFQEGLAVLWAYINYQELAGLDIGVIKKKAEELGISTITNAGYRMISKEQFTKGMGIDFGTFVNSKHSIRKMAEQEITKDEIEMAVRYTGRAPSACNRQPSKVYYSLDREKNNALGKLVPGNLGFNEEIPYYCVITADRTLFGANEMFQWFVNGGIFVGYFVLALHSLGIGSCIFQWPLFYDQEANLRNLIHADKKEAIIAIVGYGKYPDEAKCICAERKPLEELAITF